MKKLIVIAIVSLASIFLLISILYGQKEKQVVSAERLKIVAMNKLSNIPLRAKLFDLENWVFKAPGGCCHPPAFNSLLSMVIAYPPSFVGKDNFPDELRLVGSIKRGRGFRGDNLWSDTSKGVYLIKKAVRENSFRLC